MNDVPETSERVVFSARRHWASYFTQILRIILLASAGLVMLVASRQLPPSELHVIASLLSAFILLFAWMQCMVLWMRYNLSMLILTDRRVYYVENSMFARSFFMWNVLDIEHVYASSDRASEAYFNYGVLGLQAHGRVSAIRGIPRPAYVSSLILKQEGRYDELVMNARKQKELLMFISHEVKGQLTKNKAAFASILEGDFGPVSQNLSSLAESALSETQKGVETVISILRSPDQRPGLKFDMKLFDLSAAVQNVVNAFKDAASAKGLELRGEIDEKAMFYGDEIKICRLVLGNLIDNAIRYTPSGAISVMLEKQDARIIFTVADTGVGISKEDMARLFTEGGHGSDSTAVNKDSTGYGLFIARQVVEAHGGRIDAASTGRDEGSRFTVEFPVTKKV